MIDRYEAAKNDSAIQLKSHSDNNIITWIDKKWWKTKIGKYCDVIQKPSSKI